MNHYRVVCGGVEALTCGPRGRVLVVGRRHDRLEIVSALVVRTVVVGQLSERTLLGCHARSPLLLLFVLRLRCEFMENLVLYGRCPDVLLEVALATLLRLLGHWQIQRRKFRYVVLRLVLLGNTSIANRGDALSASSACKRAHQLN